MVISTGINGEMGRGGQLIWRHPGDMAHFKRITLGGTLIMGRKTWESLPLDGLPGRRIAVLTNTSIRHGIFFNNIYEILEKTPGPHYLIGGAEICKAFEHLCHELWLTRFDAGCPDADAIYQPELAADTWSCVERHQLPPTDTCPTPVICYLRRTY